MMNGRGGGGEGGRERRSTLLHFRTVHKGMNFAQRIWDSDCIFCKHGFNPLLPSPPPPTERAKRRDCLRKIVARRTNDVFMCLALRITLHHGRAVSSSSSSTSSSSSSFSSSSAFDVLPKTRRGLLADN